MKSETVDALFAWGALLFVGALFGVIVLVTP